VPESGFDCKNCKFAYYPIEEDQNEIAK
jgi:hypothetical protein